MENFGNWFEFEIQVLYPIFRNQSTNVILKLRFEHTKTNLNIFNQDLENNFISTWKFNIIQSRYYDFVVT